MLCVVTDLSVKPWWIMVNGVMCYVRPKCKTLIDCGQWICVVTDFSVKPWLIEVNGVMCFD